MHLEFTRHKAARIWTIGAYTCTIEPPPPPQRETEGKKRKKKEANSRSADCEMTFPTYTQEVDTQHNTRVYWHRWLSRSSASSVRSSMSANGPTACSAWYSSDAATKSRAAWSVSEALNVACNSHINTAHEREAFQTVSRVSVCSSYCSLL